MSRIGKKEILIPDGVTVALAEISEGTKVTVKGPKGELERVIRPEIAIAELDSEGKKVIKLTVAKQTKKSNAFYGLSRTLVSNMVDGVTKGFSKKLEIQGVGYRATLQGASINFQLGKSHPEVIDPPQGITFTVDAKANTILVEGADKELVGRVSANIRDRRKVEPYKGKGIRYEGEYVRRKAGKSGK